MRCDALFPEISQSNIEQNIEGLARLRLKLDLAVGEGRVTSVNRALEYDYANKEHQFVQYLEAHSLMTRQQMLEKMRAYVEIIQAKQTHMDTDEEQRRELRQTQFEKATVNGERIIFQNIRPGSFLRGRANERIPVTITKGFGIAATLTTQEVWKAIALRAKNQFPGEYVRMMDEPSYFKGRLNPVEAVSYEDIQNWLEAANRLIAAGDPIVRQLMPGVTKGMRLRLPTDAEWEFVARARGAAMTDYFYGDSELEIEEYAWTMFNSGKTTHPVAEKKPLELDGQLIYDLYGNVRQWTSDVYSPETPIGGIDPQIPGPPKSNRVTRGGHWDESATSMRSFSRHCSSTLDRFTGFRLVIDSN